MQKFKFFTLAILAMLSANVWGAVTPLSLPKEWDASAGKSAYTEASGCTLSGLGSDYSSAPKLKFDSQGDYMIIQVADAPDEISFNIKGNSVSGTYSFRVQESDDGSSYTDALNITSVTASSANKSASLKSSTRYIKLIYTTKASGNMGVGGISITKATAGGDGDWELVTDASTLKAGDILVIGCSSEGATAGDISSSIMASISSTFNAAKTKITELGEGTVELTLGGTSGAWTFANSSKQLLGATAVKKVAWGSGTTTWSISISDGIATIQNGTSSYGRFLYNVGSPRFIPYTSATSATMLLPQLYRKPSYTVTAQSNNTDLGTVVSGTTSITASPNECVGYDDPAYTVAPEGKATVNQSGNTFTVSNVTADVTVTINFAELDKKDTYVDNLHGNATIERCGSYEAPSLPDAAKPTTEDCDAVHYHFAGWVIGTISTGTTDAPLGMITAGTAMNANKTEYIAVWAKEQ